MDTFANYLIGLAPVATIAVLGWNAYLTRRLSTLEVHVAEQYARQSEITKINETTASIQRSLSEILRTLHELKGRMDGMRHERVGG